jgi:peptidoglycan/xylan/chitin deacetylase (PgdA/CDA1 family)
MSFAYRLNAFATRQLPMKLARLRHDRPIASFSFDDFPKSAWTAGGPILERHGAKATYYAVGGFSGRTVEGVEQYDEIDLRAVHASGHEIGCHTYSHERGPGVSSDELKGDVARNAAYLEGVLGDGYRPETFAYPYGEVSPRTKALFAKAFPLSRGIRPGVNGSLSDLSQLRAVPLEARSWTAAEVERWVAAAKASNGWLVFFSHDVADAPSPYGCTPAMLEHALSCVRGSGFEILTVKDALAKASA